MKKYFKNFKRSVLILACTMFAGCGFIFGGKVTDCQKHKPADGTHRKVRPAALLGDIATGGIWFLADYFTGGLFKPCQDKK